METARDILNNAMQGLKDDNMDDGWVLTADQKFQNSKLFPDPAVINRVVFLTDMLPNQGKAAWHQLYALTAEMAEQQSFFSTFVGVGTGECLLTSCSVSFALRPSSWRSSPLFVFGCGQISTMICTSD
jgi:hypothetical protein